MNNGYYQELVTINVDELKDLRKENEKLKQENQKLKEKNIEANYNKVLYRKFAADNLAENEKLKKAIEIIKREKIKPSAFLGTLRNYKECYKVDMPYERACILLDCDITEEEFILLKEVLGE